MKQILASNFEAKIFHYNREIKIPPQKQRGSKYKLTLANDLYAYVGLHFQSDQAHLHWFFCTLRNMCRFVYSDVCLCLSSSHDWNICPSFARFLFWCFANLEFFNFCCKYVTLLSTTLFASRKVQQIEINKMENWIRKRKAEYQLDFAALTKRIWVSSKFVLTKSNLIV